MTTWTSATTKRVRRLTVDPEYVALLLFAIVSLVLLFAWYRHQINPDATSYISIARKYARFDLREAINGYWGPLFSLLLVPFLWLHIDPIIAGKLLNLAASIAVLFVFHRLVKDRLGLSRGVRWLLLALLMQQLIVWLLPGPLTPDILMVLVLLVVAMRLDTTLAQPTARNIGWLSATAFVLYLTKYAGLFLYLGVVTLTVVVTAARERRYRHHLVLWSKLVACVLLLVAPVAVVLSIKYHHPTVSTAGAYNHGILAPDSHGVPRHPMLTTGPLAPPNDTAYSVWEDPSRLPVPKWSIFGSRRNLTYFIGTLVIHNARVTIDHIVSFGPIIAVGFVILVISLVRSREPLLTIAGATAVVLVAGYLTLVPVARYSWTVVPLSLLAIGHAGMKVLQDARLRRIAAAVILLLGVTTMTQHLTDGRDVGLDAAQQAGAIAPYVPAHSRIVSDTFLSIYTCMYNDYQCYGVIDPTGDASADRALYDSLKTIGVGYFVDFGAAAPNPAIDRFLTGYAHLVAEAAPHLTIYAL